jgi:integrase
MAHHGSFLYRRNGRFYARLRVPQNLQALYLKSDLRVSLNTSDYSAACLRVLETVLSWKRAFVRLQAMLDARQVVTGSPLLLIAGLMPIADAAHACGLTIDTMLREAIKRGAEMRLEASGWQGSDVPAMELKTDYDGALLPDDTLRGRECGAITGTLYLRRESLPLVQDGMFADCLFYRDARRRQAVVVRFPGISVPVGGLLIPNADAEAIRCDIAGKVTPTMLDAAAAMASRQPPAAPAHKHDGMRASELLKEFFRAKSPTWSAATRESMRSMCGAFVELTGDPKLGEIDRVAILRYREQLLKLPHNLPVSRRRLGVTTLADLVTAAAGAGLPSMKEQRADEYLTKIGEAFSWAERKGFMLKNPAIGAVERRKKSKREQDEREEFSDENLRLIFSAPWFASGKGTLTSLGTYRTFQPFQYWLPALALFSGGRLNELSQLHLVDIQRTAAGTWFLDFNLVGSGKIDEPDKRLKTVNSIRKVPLHPELVRLGLPEYVQALAGAGYDRLFPELRFDRVKGYGGAPGHWFNERFLGMQLGIPRNGRQVFHSFRHSFVSALYRLDPAPGEFIINQLSGHERGETMSAKRYAKDAGPDALRAHVDRPKFNIPTIAPFDVAEGLVAARHALDRKIKA